MSNSKPINTGYKWGKRGKIYVGFKEGEYKSPERPISYALPYTFKRT